MGGLGLSFQRHAHRHREKGLDRRLCLYHDGDDACDALLRGFSRWGLRPLGCRWSYPITIILPEQFDALGIRAPLSTRLPCSASWLLPPLSSVPSLVSIQLLVHLYSLRQVIQVLIFDPRFQRLSAVLGELRYSKWASVDGRPLARIRPLGHILRHKAFWTRSTRSSSEPSPRR
jgi:hypothetical protein